MPARKTPREGMKKVRVRLSLLLTRGEISAFEARAAEDLRPIGQYVAVLILESLESRKRGRGGTSATPRDKRQAYDVAVPLTIPERRLLEEKAKKEMRSVSNYVTKLVLSDLAKS